MDNTLSSFFGYGKRADVAFDNHNGYHVLYTIDGMTRRGPSNLDSQWQAQTIAEGFVKSPVNENIGKSQQFLSE